MQLIQLFTIEFCKLSEERLNILNQLLIINNKYLTFVNKMKQNDLKLIYDLYVLLISNI